MGESPLSSPPQPADLGSLASQCRTGGERGPRQDSCATVCGLSALVITVGTPNCSRHMISGLNVLWPKKVASHIVKPSAIDVDTAERVYHALVSSFPPA